MIDVARGVGLLWPVAVGLVAAAITWQLGLVLGDDIAMSAKAALGVSTPMAYLVTMLATPIAAYSVLLMVAVRGFGLWVQCRAWAVVGLALAYLPIVLFFVGPMLFER